jgi:hypothetical protein
MERRILLNLNRLAPVTSFLSSLFAIACPLCIPAFGALLSSIGFGFALNFQFLRGTVIALLLLSVFSLAWSARLHKQWAIFFFGTLGAGLVYGGRHLWYSLPLMVIGALMLISASVWNLRAKFASKKCDDEHRKGG